MVFVYLGAVGLLELPHRHAGLGDGDPGGGAQLAHHLDVEWGPGHLLHELVILAIITTVLEQSFELLTPRSHRFSTLLSERLISIL